MIDVDAPKMISTLAPDEGQEWVEEMEELLDWVRSEERGEEGGVVAIDSCKGGRILPADTAAAP